MEDFKNTDAPVIREEIYDKIFKKDKLNIVYSIPGRGAGFLCKNLIVNLKKEIPNLKVVEAIDAQSVDKVLRNLFDDIYAIKRLKDLTDITLPPILYYIDISDISPNLENKIHELYNKDIIKNLNIFILLKTCSHNSTVDKDTNRSSISNNSNTIYIENEHTNYRLFLGNTQEESIKKVIENSVESLSNESIPMYINIEHCRNIIDNACSYIKDIITIENLQKCNSYLIKVGNKLKENETSII